MVVGANGIASGNILDGGSIQVGNLQSGVLNAADGYVVAVPGAVFNVGGVGTLEEIGIELCNLKLGIRPRVPYVFFNAKFWGDLRRQIREMIRTKRAPAWMADYILFTDDPDEVVAFYRKKLQVL